MGATGLATTAMDITSMATTAIVSTGTDSTNMDTIVMVTTVMATTAAGFITYIIIEKQELLMIQMDTTVMDSTKQVYIVIQEQKTI